MKKSESSRKRKYIIAAIAAAVAVAAAFSAFVFRENIYDLFFAPDIPLQLVSSPKSITVESGYTAVFDAEAEGNGLSYAWEYTASDGTVGKIKGKIGARLSLVTDMTMNANTYRCIVTDRNGATVVSDGATLTVTKDHTFGEMLVTKENTCLSDGEATYICSSCGEKKTETLPAKGHDFTESVSYTGKRLFVCKVCSYSFETDAADKSALDEALEKIPKYVSVYYSGSAAKTLSSIKEKLDSVVYGVTNYDLLSQSETDDYADRINTALNDLALKKTDGKNIYITSYNTDGDASLSATDGNSVNLKDADIRLSDAKLYSETKKASYNLTLSTDGKLFSFDSANLLLLSLSEDPTLMRTPIMYNCADRLGISEAPNYEMAHVYLDGEYLGLYAVRAASPTLAEDTASLRDEIVELFSSKASYDEIKERVDTARFARFVILYCTMGFSDSVNIDSLLFEDGEKISIHLPAVCDGILRPDSRADISNELGRSAIIAALTQNDDFMAETRYVYALSADKIQNICTQSDAAESESESTAENETTAPDTEDETVSAASSSSATATEGNAANENEPVSENEAVQTASTADMSSFARFKTKYQSEIEKNFADGKITYADSFGKTARYTSFDKNAHALAETLRARLTAADNYFTP